jgi:hypothetical protein
MGLWKARQIPAYTEYLLIYCLILAHNDSILLVRELQ